MLTSSLCFRANCFIQTRMLSAWVLGGATFVESVCLPVNLSCRIFRFLDAEWIGNISMVDAEWIDDVSMENTNMLSRTIQQMLCQIFKFILQ